MENSCKRCGVNLYMAWGLHTSEGAECSDCRSIKENGDIQMDSSVRCPSCRHVMCVSELEIWDEGDHDVSCDDCGHDFEVNTSVSYTFSSPKMLDTE